MATINPARLRAILLNTGLQQKDNPLYQFLNSLITDLVGIALVTNNISGGGGGGSVVNNITNVLSGMMGFDGSPGEDAPFIPGNQSSSSGGITADYVVASDGATPIPSPVDDGFGNFIYIPYTP